MKERIKEIRKVKNMTQSEFGEKIGVKGNTIATYENGTRTPSDAVILSICREYKVSESWLRTGQGEMFIHMDEDQELDYILGQISASEDDTIKRIIRAYWRLDDLGKAAVRKLIDGLLDDAQAK